MSSMRIISLLLLASTLVFGQKQLAEERFGESQARHLLNRGGFGGTPDEIKSLADMGLKKAVQLILHGIPNSESSAAGFDLAVIDQSERRKMRSLPQKERQKIRQQMRQVDRRQMARYRTWWVEQMLGATHPFQEKLTLFWHGYFTSSFRSVRNSEHIINQNRLFREEGLGNFRTLLRHIARDPAMLRYLDNDKNRKGAPNENFAREVMELFTLGEGNYTEEDIKETARAFTGWINRPGGARFMLRRHDRGEKSILGRKGRYGVDDALDVILQRPAAPLWVSKRILRYFVGSEIPDGMVSRYARLLRKNDWELLPFFEALFSDAQFYSPLVVGNRISSPIEFLVGIGRRLGENPPGWLIVTFSDQLGQSLMDPPNVKGWEGVDAWITTSSFMQRGNFARYLIEGFDRRSVVADFASDGTGKMDMRQARSGIGSMMRGMRQRRWHPEVRMRELLIEAKVTNSADIVNFLCQRFLGVPVTDEARSTLVAFLENEKKSGKSRFRKARALEVSEDLLRRLVHLILSLPEAQLV